MTGLKIIYLLIPIFIIAVFIRFLYFPNNIYFGFDQARDAFATREILNGHLKLIGPPTSFEGLRHGVLYYYLYAPLYWISHGDPTATAAFLRIVNASGIILIFAIAAILFNKYIGLISAWLFAISFEQTQFSMYLNHPSLAVISILLMYLGLSLLIFRKKDFGLIIALLGLGLSVQFEFILTYLFIPFALILLVFRKSIPRLNFTAVFLALITFFLTVLTFVIAEIKFSFRSANLLPQLLFGGNEKSLYKIISTYLFEMGQIIKFNLVGSGNFSLISRMLLLGVFIFLVFSQQNKKMIFLGIWFFSVLVTYIVTGGEDIKAGVLQYHQNVGISCSLIIFVSFLLYSFGKKFLYPTLFIILLITFANFYQIVTVNKYGSMPQINAQSFMLLSDEKKVLDLIYQNASGEAFAVKGVTLPFYINTTWSYLFEWYGKQKYGYLPVWSGKNAFGYPGNLLVEETQSKLPAKRYLIIEPTRGIPAYLINDYLREESYFTILQEEYNIGSFIVQKRKAK